MLIGITGLAGSGKDTMANYLWHRHRFTRIAFADPLKRAAQEIFGLSDEETWDRELKEVEISYWGLSPRRMFQVLGTEAMQGTFGRDVWMKRWMLSYNLLRDTDHVVVPDVRFEAEAQAIKDLGGVIARVTRNTCTALSLEAQNHVSELGIPSVLVDVTFENDGTIDEFHAKITSFLTGRGFK